MTQERDLVGQAHDAMAIVTSHELSGIPLDFVSYGAKMQADLEAAHLRRFYDRNLAAGRLIHDGGDGDGKPTIERRPPRDNPTFRDVLPPLETLESRARKLADAWQADHGAVDPDALDRATRLAVRAELASRKPPTPSADAR